MMEKHGEIDTAATPPENAPLGATPPENTPQDATTEKQAAAKQALLFALEQDSAKRMADHASECCGGSCESSKPVVDN